MDDVHPDDPVFVLRRAISYRSSTSRHRLSAPLDEIALQHLHRESAASSVSSDPTNDDSKKTAPSRQEIIAAQRAATRANQRAILSAQTNSVRGMDVLLPGNAMLRSSRYEIDDKMRYSYVLPDGETYDISDIVEEELRDGGNKNDLLESVLGGRNKDRIGEKLDRVLSKIKNGRQAGIVGAVSQSRSQTTVSSRGAPSSRSRSASPASQYSLDDVATVGRSKSATPGSVGLNNQPTSSLGRAASAQATLGRSSPAPDGPRPGTTTPRQGGAPVPPPNRRQPSIASVMSDLSGYVTAPSTHPLGTPDLTAPPTPTPKQQQRRMPMIPADEFGVSHMMAIIEYKGTMKPKTPLPPLDPVDALLFGRPVDTRALHPKIADVYASGFKMLDEMDKVCFSAMFIRIVLIKLW